MWVAIESPKEGQALELGGNQQNLWQVTSFLFGDLGEGFPALLLYPAINANSMSTLATMHIWS
jgi:hypothetical protein